MADAAAGSDALRGVLPSILAKAKVVISPYPFGLSDDDNLRVTSVNAVAGVTLQVHYRLLTRDGQVKAGVFSHTPNTNRTAKTDDFNLAGGFITNLSVFATAGAPLIGQCFVIVQLIRGIGSVAIVLGTMLQGYVTTTQGLGWPGSAIVSSTDGEPAIRTIVGTMPAANTDVLETVPAGARWEVLAFRTPLTIGAGGVALNPVLSIDDGTNFIADWRAGASSGASTVNPFTWAQGFQANAGAVTGGNAVQAPLPSNRLLAGHRIRVTIGVFAGFPYQWAAPIYNVREWQEAK